MAVGHEYSAYKRDIGVRVEALSKFYTKTFGSCYTSNFIQSIHIYMRHLYTSPPVAQVTQVEIRVRGLRWKIQRDTAWEIPTWRKDGKIWGKSCENMGKSMNIHGYQIGSLETWRILPRGTFFLTGG